MSAAVNPVRLPDYAVEQLRAVCRDAWLLGLLCGCNRQCEPAFARCGGRILADGSGPGPVRSKNARRKRARSKNIRCR